jgi:hypothetical protein
VRRLIAAVGSSIAVIVGVQLVLAGPALAVAAPHTGPSYYVGGYNIAEMQHLGAHDGGYAHTYCIPILVVLDFGRPARYTLSTAYGGYGTLAVSGHYGSTYLTDGGIYNMAYQYAINFAANGSCGTLNLDLGINNSFECNGTNSGLDLTPCSTQTAGYNWGLMAKNLAAGLASYSNVHVNMADDVEGGAGGGWDCYTATNTFYVGAFSYTGTSMYIDDYGDVAYGEGPCRQGTQWTLAQLTSIATGQRRMSGGRPITTMGALRLQGFGPPLELHPIQKQSLLHLSPGVSPERCRQ